MNERQVILYFLFPPHQQASCAIGPGVGALHDPSPRLGASVVAGLVRLFSLRGHVQLISALSHQTFHRLSRVAFVEAEMLPAAAPRTRSRHGNAGQRFLHESLIVSVGSGHRHRQRNATTVSQHRTLDTEFSAVGGVFSGFFPRPAVTSSSPHPNFAISTRCRAVDHTPSGKLATISRRHPTLATPESSDVPCSTNQSTWATPSTGNPCGASKRFRQSRAVASRAGDRPSGWVDTVVIRAPVVARVPRGLAQTFRSSRNAFLPPCCREETSVPCSTSGVCFCSVMG